MRRTKECLIAVLLLIVALGMACSSDPVVNGGGTDFPNTRTVAGVMLSSTGDPVDNGRVVLVRNITGQNDPLPRFLYDTLWSSANGSFAFEGVSPGLYALEAISPDGAQIAYHDSIFLANDDVWIDTLRLNPGGSLRGIVTMRPGLSVVLEISSTHYMVEPDSLGRFFFPVLPQGNWDLNIIILDSSRTYREHDTTLAGQTVDDSTVLTQNVILPEIYTARFVRKLFLNTTETGAGIAAMVTGFPVAVRLDSTRIDFSQSLPTGSDVRFMKSDGTILPCQIEEWDAQRRSALFWVLADTVWGDSLQPLYVVWGDTAVTPVSSVFDTANGFRGVFHLGEDAAGTGTVGVFADASLLGARGTDYASATGKTGILGKGQQFDGVDDYIQILPVIQLPETFTISLWIKADEVPVDNRALRLMGTYKDPWDTLYGFMFHTFNNDFSFATGNGTTPNTAGSWDVFVASWTHLALTFVPGTGAVEVFVDGESATSDGFAGGVVTYVNGVGTLISDPWSPFKGSIDEVRFENARRSASWIRLCYENQKVRQTLVEF